MNLVNLFKKKGLFRQAVLLELEESRGEYLEALANPFWENEIKSAVGAEAYKIIKANSNSSKFRSRDYKPSSLELTVENTFGVESLRELRSVAKKADSLFKEMHNLIYSEANKIIGGNEDLMYEIYKDEDKCRTAKSYQEISELRFRFEERLKDAIELTEKSIYVSVSGIRGENFKIEDIDLDEFLYPDSLINQCKMLGERMGLASKDIRKNGKTLKGYLVFAKEILKDDELLGERFQEWLKNQKDTTRERIIERGHRFLDPDEECDFSEYLGVDWEPEGHLFELLSDVEINRDLSEINSKEEEIEVLSRMLKIDLEERVANMTSHNMYVGRLNKLFVGAKQIIEGGPVTNPNITKVSVMQNDGLFPNLSYSDKTKDELKVIVNKANELMDKLPDVEDYATSSRMRKRKSLVYSMEELPKNPLKVTFGNDAQCCIFVSETVEDMQNGFTVAHYLNDDAIRLFSIYRTETKGAKRPMGLVVAFETERKDGTNNTILSCNSLELSRFGITGGRSTIKSIVDYAENYLIEYAKKYDYDGATMGIHTYNTSENFSSKANDKVEESLEFKGKYSLFYSDVFQFNPVTESISTRPNSEYWLWKKN